MTTSSWFPLHCHSHFSLLDGLSKPEQIADRLEECGHAGSAVTDHGSVSGCPAFHKALTGKGLKPILGEEFYLCKQDAALRTPENGPLTHLVVLAKSARGWKNLMRASSASWKPEFSYRKPRLDLERLASFSGGEFVTFSGHMGSDLADACFDEPKLAYRAATVEEARALVRADWQESVLSGIANYRRLFGADNFWVEINIVDHENLPASLVVAELLRECAKQASCPTVATADSHYCRPEDAKDQRVLLCLNLGTTLAEVERQIAKGDDVTLGGFFKSDRYHIPTAPEMGELHRGFPDELRASLNIAELCEAYRLGGEPRLPKFTCPSDRSQEEHLRALCQSGWEKKVAPKVPERLWPKYRARLEETELPVIVEAGLAGYFLIVEDLVRYAREVLRKKVGKGRGSAAGCLVSYLLDVTRVDPLEYDLDFSRFYDSSRKGTMPDIDCDFDITAREPLIEYARNKYGRDKVCQMATFSRMQGRGALKDVLRVKGRLTFEEVNAITDSIPDEAAIADKLEEMREETGEASIILWALQNFPEPLKEYVVLSDDGTLDGPLAFDFEQAIRLEGTRRSMGKHASGLVIADEPLEDIAPMVFDKGTGEAMLAVDYREAEQVLGLLKFDILGLRTLRCLADAESFIRTGRAA